MYILVYFNVDVDIDVTVGLKADCDLHTWHPQHFYFNIYHKIRIAIYYNLSVDDVDDEI